MSTPVHNLVHTFIHRAIRAAGRTAPVCAVLLIPALVLATPGAAHAGPGGLAAEVATLPQVIYNLQAWLMGILAGIATLFLVLAGVYWATAGGDPATVERAKSALKNALIGYGLAVLAPVLLAVVKGIVGG